MKKLLKVAGGLAALLVLVLGGLVGALVLKKPAMRPPSTERIERTPERIARGVYLTHHVADCLNCHSDHMTERYGIPIKPGTEGQGGFPFDEKLAIPGIVCAQNITPDEETGLGRWSDGEVLRAVREGVDRDGNTLFPMMPYESFRSMSDEDARSVVAYLRTLPSVKNAVPAKRINFPVNLLVKAAPKPVEGSIATPDDSKDHLGYGRYLTTIGGCANCHTPQDKGKPIAGMELAGGWEMLGPWGRVVTANITPHPDTFVGRATKAEFIARFKAFEKLQGENAPVAKKGQNTVMPWLSYAGMTEQDLGAIYDYLKTVKPIEHKVVTFPDAPAEPVKS